MNSCVLMAQVMSEPELRYTTDNTALAQMLIEFPALREGDPPNRIKAVGWGNLGTEIQQTFHEGDQVILVGRLSMNTIDRPEGFKEKKVEFVISQIEAVGAGMSMTAPMAAAPAPVYTHPVATTPSNVVPLSSAYQQQSEPAVSPSFDHGMEPEPNLDDIPF
jgi:single-strand DNA-binding protein